MNGVFSRLQGQPNGRSLYRVGVFLLMVCISVISQTKAADGAVPDSPSLLPVRSVHPLEDLPGFQRTLLASYLMHREVTIGERTHKEVELRGLRYKPRQASYEGFEGWDVLELPVPNYSRRDWLTLSFNRPTRVVLVWEHDATWLRDWQRGKLGPRNTFTKEVSASNLMLPPAAPDKGTYTLLFAESGGYPSEPPPLPQGVSESERPRANQTCPTWLHDSYLTEGPEGGLYQTWHPQIDPAYWCYFGHEHGSDPALVNYTPAFKYVATKNDRQNEQHEGFKGFAVRDEAQGLGWYFNVHATSSAPGRLCTRFHTVVIAVTDLETGELLAELGYKGDFGALRTTEKVDGTNRLVQPEFLTDCPSQGDIAEQTDAVKKVRVQNEPVIKRGGYEKWEGGVQAQLGVTSSKNGLHLDIRDPLSECDGLECSRFLTTGLAATTRSLKLNKIDLGYTEGVAALDLADGKRDGVFYTDPYGAESLSPDSPRAVRQYIRPDWHARVDGFLVSEDPWQMRYEVNGGRVTSLELEDAIGAEN